MEPCADPACVGEEVVRSLLPDTPTVTSTDPLLCGAAACKAAAAQRARHTADTSNRRQANEAGPLEPGRREAPAARHAGGAQHVQRLQAYRAVDVRHADTLSYEEFVVDYMAPNRPVLIKGVTNGWRAAREWVLPAPHAAAAPTHPAGACDSPPAGPGPAHVECAPCRSRWRQVARPNIDALVAAAGRAVVPVTETARQDDGPGPCVEMTLEQYARWWRQHAAARAAAARASGTCAACWRGSGDTTGAAAALGAHAAQPSDACTPQGAPQPHAQGQLLYLKDFHFVGECPRYGAYRLPVYFSEDWLNAFFDSRAAAPTSTAPGATAALHSSALSGAAVPASESGGGQADADAAAAAAAAAAACAAEAAGHDGAGVHAGGGGAACSDYRFVYLGPAGTWTPLHADVLRSYSWSANVAGRKRWLLLAPEQTHLLYDTHGRQLAPHFGREHYTAEDQLRLPDIDTVRVFPHLQHAGPHLAEVVQESGDALFVPSGWHHTVHNHADTLSINHNWINAYNAHWAWALLRQGHADAAEGIEDVRPLCSSAWEFEALVQRNLSANAGLSWADWARLLCAAARGALAGLAAAAQQEQVHAWDALHALGPRSSAPCSPIPRYLLELQRAGGLLREVLSAQRAALGPKDAAQNGLAAAAGTWREMAAAVSAGDAGADPTIETIETATLSAYADAEAVADMAERALAQHAALLQ